MAGPVSGQEHMSSEVQFRSPATRQVDPERDLGAKLERVRVAAVPLLASLTRAEESARHEVGRHSVLLIRAEVARAIREALG
jgi:hypothetical protein